jgi:hypothetical protein
MGDVGSCLGVHMFVRLAIVAFALVPAIVKGGVVVNFSSDPNWASTGSGSNGNSFGYQTTASAGGAPGEGGGRFTRSSFARYYADTGIGPTTTSDALSASGLLDVTDFNFPDFGPGLLVGFFDTAGLSEIGFLLNNNDSGGLYVDLFVQYADGTEDRVPLSASLSPNVDRVWGFEWNPTTGLLTGSLSGPDAGSASLSVNTTTKSAAFDSFGLWSAPTSPLSGNRDRSDWFADIFIDDVQYQVGVVPEASSIVAWSVVIFVSAVAVTFRRRWAARH